MPEPTLAEVRDDVRKNLELDKRLRYVEVKTAEMGAIVTQLDKALPAMESRLMHAIQESKPKNLHAWVAVGVASLAAVLGPILSALMR